MTEHWRVYATGRCRPGCPGCAAAARRRLLSLLAFVLFVAGWVLLGWSFPAAGEQGVALGVSGVVLFGCAGWVVLKAGGRR